MQCPGADAFNRDLTHLPQCFGNVLRNMTLLPHLQHFFPTQNLSLPSYLFVSWPTFCFAPSFSEPLSASRIRQMPSARGSWNRGCFPPSFYLHCPPKLLKVNHQNPREALVLDGIQGSLKCDIYISGGGEVKKKE